MLTHGDKLVRLDVILTLQVSEADANALLAGNSDTFNDLHSQLRKVSEVVPCIVCTCELDASPCTIEHVPGSLFDDPLLRDALTFNQDEVEAHAETPYPIPPSVLDSFDECVLFDENRIVRNSEGLAMLFKRKADGQAYANANGIRNWSVVNVVLIPTDAD